MLANAFLIVWNDVVPEIEAEYRRWHRVEHMPERLAIPGFMLGRRYADPDAAKYRYLTIYEVESNSVFSSSPYRASLASPTPWTARMSAQMTNFVRRVCRTAASESVGIGGAAATFHLSVDADPRRLIRMAAGMDGVTGAHVGVVDQAATGVRRDEMQSRSQQDTRPFDSVLIVESDSRDALTRLMPALNDGIAQSTGQPPVFGHVYNLALTFLPTHGVAPGNGKIKS